jgi:branched-chain amino acid transport system ATP-binding protein
LLRIDELTVRYGPIAALHGISLEVNEGEVVGLIGPNGAGKSTTLNTIVGLIKPASGSITFDGRSIVGQVPAKIARSGIALVPEGRRIFGRLTVAENLQLGAAVRKDRAQVAEDLERTLDLFGVLRTYYSQPADRLSGGEQQQLAIARALLGRPRLLLLDEPSLGLAPIIVDLVFDVLAELKRDGVTILLVEQVAARTAEFADRSYVLRTGRIALSGTRDELDGKADFAHAYLGALDEV